MDTQEFWDDYQHLKKEVTKLRTSEARLKAIRARYAALFDAVQVLVAVVDRDGTILEINPAGLTLLGVRADELIGRGGSGEDTRAPSLLRPAEEDQAGEIVRELARRAGEAIRRDDEILFDWTLPAGSGSARWLAGRALPVRDETNRAAAAVIVARDMTELMDLDEDLARAQTLLDDLRTRARLLIDRGQRT